MKIKTIKPQKAICLDDESCILENIRHIYHLSNTKKKRLYSNTIKAVFRSATDDKKVEYVSKAALKKAKELGIDLYSMTWLNQNKFDPKRKIFHYEHCNPIKELRSAVLDTDESTQKILKRDIVCWILKSENKELDKHGYREKRPGGWQKCYKECGIKFVKNKKNII